MSTEAAEILDSTPKEVAPPVAEVLEPQALAKPEDKVSSRIDILIQREQRARQAEMSARKQEESVADKLKRLEEFDQAKGGNAKKALELMGLTYDQLSQALLKDGDLPPEVGMKKLEDRISSFEAEQQEKERKAQEENKRRVEEQEKVAVNNFKGEINQYVLDNKDRYELIAFEEQQDLIFEVIDEHYNRTMNVDTGSGKVMSIKEAADKVEEHLEKKYNKSRELNKVKSLWSSIPKETQSQMLKQQLAPFQQPPKTLTNTMSATPAPKRKAPVTDEERVARAVAYARSLRPNL